MKLYSKIVIASLVAILASAFNITSPAHAASSGNIDAEVNITPSLNVTIPSDTVTLNLNPLTTPFASANLAVTVATNNPTGYTLTMSPVTANTTSLTRNGGTETIQTLADLSGGYTEQTFTTNRWGYKLSSGNYLPFTNSNTVGSSNAPTNGTANTVTFASKIDTTQAAGTYELEINFAAIANAPPAHTIADGGNMQDVSSAVDGGCPSALTTGQAYTLTDHRGGQDQAYKVARLADGNCWMLDNLALGGSSAIALTPADTNIATNWTLPASDTNNFNWDNASFTTAAINADSKYTTVTSYGSGSGKVGVYYNYCAASAGTYCYGMGAGTGNAEHDVCPKGWRMPTGGSSGEYQALYTAYNSNETSFRTALSITLTGEFLQGSALSQGSYVGLYSTTIVNGNGMYSLYVDSDTVNPQNGSSRIGGYPVRCMLD